MKLSDDVIIPATRETVWKALNDPHVLKQCIPGCESITKHSDTSMEAKVTLKLGPVKASYKGAVTLSDLDPPNGYRISGEGKSLMGSAAGGADVRLETVPEGTRLSYDVDVQVGGKIASLAAALHRTDVAHARRSVLREAGRDCRQDGACGLCGPGSKACPEEAGGEEASSEEACREESRYQEACVEEGRCKEEALICHSR